ncbi:cobyric acid synthase [Halorubrum ezzemoulense]|uniref:Probable cobyric acid synthase n=1 Tax=Halorubrum ezzemoulense TaxID=337243 RepID=A0ABT4Z4G9_HALEZ|nr:cobyric acid synthase [Halorubrum ezzemoulense]MDB2245105.1 cobyric acid synthase [Halorubrum ezzemoulense]MDB2252591.1 cobyric acid synthase [Halorubrum ezzemoulense]MDB2278137.1 cobyric acid synthase [Halorubrum ezzemoulense]MDB2284811.1 cobyric acid synthase [Halorubrum ezzemoulense]MDB2288441.1 cobyric acid synthase [Halorubrum ezzemoulense]
MTDAGADEGGGAETDPESDADTVLIAGTASHVGKSTLAAGLCRLLARRGVSVAPYKAQNMSNNARVALAPDGEWGEVGVSQHVQARAAETVPTTDVNPVLLKPRGGGESQVIVDGEAVANAPASTYYDDHWATARDAAVAAHERLAADHDVIVAEGAGSIAEINLHDRDLANVECARFADAAILIAVDIERGGAFASLYGTLELLPDDLRERVCGAVITKFRGDPALLEPGIDEIEARTGVPVVGVVPHDDPGLPAEDSLSLPDAATAEDGSGGGGTGSGGVLGTDDGVPDDEAVRVGVPRLPRISNFTDLEPLAREPGVRVAYLPLDAALDGVDAVVLPGSKNTVDDLLALREAGFDGALRAFDAPVVGVCGGYQLLGERLLDAAVEGVGDREAVPGVGLLPVETRFSTEKRVERVTRAVDGVGPIAGAEGRATGYEIRAGRTRVLDDGERDAAATLLATEPLGAEGVATDRVLGTYLHGLFETAAVRDAFVETVFASAGRTRPDATTADRSPYERAADLVADHVDLAAAGLDELLGSAE